MSDTKNKQPVVLNELDSKFKYEIAARPGGENFKKCFSCGTCTATCPVSEVAGEYNPRKIIRQALLGMRKEVLSSPTLWLCASCYACYAHCPQNVKFTDVMQVLREMAEKEGYVPPDFGEAVKAVDQFAQNVRVEAIKYLFDGEEKRVEDVKKSFEEKVHGLKKEVARKQGK